MARGSDVRRQNFWPAAGGPSQSRVCRNGAPVKTCRRAAKATASSSLMDHVGRVEVRSGRRPAWRRPSPALPSVNVFRKDRPLTNDLPARLGIFHSRTGVLPTKRRAGTKIIWRPRVRKSKCAAPQARQYVADRSQYAWWKIKDRRLSVSRCRGGRISGSGRSALGPPDLPLNRPEGRPKTNH